MTHLERNKMSNIIDNLEDSYAELKNFYNYDLDDIEFECLGDALRGLNRTIEMLQLTINE